MTSRQNATCHKHAFASLWHSQALPGMYGTLPLEYYLYPCGAHHPREEPEARGARPEEQLAIPAHWLMISIQAEAEDVGA